MGTWAYPGNPVLGVQTQAVAIRLDRRLPLTCDPRSLLMRPVSTRAEKLALSQRATYAEDTGSSLINRCDILKKDPRECDQHSEGGICHSKVRIFYDYQG